MNCKPGDLAIVIKSSAINKENVGKIVRVVRRWEGDEFSGLRTKQSKVWWWVESKENDLLLQNKTGTLKRGYLKGRPMADGCLHPIRGLGKTEEQTNTVKEPA